jgi:perosamine synthetase
VSEPIPFHRPYITEDEIAEVVDSLRSGWLTMGPKTVRFEGEFAAAVGAPHAVAVNSCTAALHLALVVLGVGRGDEVIIPDMTFTATGEVVCYLGARPVIVDVQPDTANIDPGLVAAAITPRTRAIVPVHFGGQPCDMDELREIAGRAGVPLIEDAAHSLPASYRGNPVGSIGDITCFSFYATKTLATGEGGMAVTANPDWAARMRTLRLHGISRDAWKRYTAEGSWYYEVEEAGYKYNMTDLQASLGLAQLRKLDWMNRRRAEIAARYTAAFSLMDPLRVPGVRDDRRTSWHLYPLRLAPGVRLDRGALIDELGRRGIGTSVHFIPLHRHPFYADGLGYRDASFPVADDLYARSLSLPIYPGMTDGEVDRVIAEVTDIVRGAA